jgi:hypothetical protein
VDKVNDVYTENTWLMSKSLSGKSIQLTSTNVAAMQQLRSSAQNNALITARYLTKSFLRTSHFLFRLRTSVHYFSGKKYKFTLLNDETTFFRIFPAWYLNFIFADNSDNVRLFKEKQS